MERQVGARRKIDILGDVLRPLLIEQPGVSVIAFHSYAEVLVGLESGRLVLPEPAGSTALHLALEAVAAQQPKRDRVVVLSDGEPDSEGAALAAARAL